MDKLEVILVPEDLSVCQRDRIHFGTSGQVYMRIVPRDLFDQIVYFLDHPETGVRRGRPRRQPEDT